MKRIFKKRVSVLLIIQALSLFTSSCSTLWSHRDQNLTEPKKAELVSKEQYDELARKYQELLTKSKSEIVALENKNASTVEEIKVAEVKKDDQKKPEAMTTTTIDPSELVNHIDSKIKDTANVHEGVEVNKAEIKSMEKGPQVPNSMAIQNVNYTEDIDDQITKLREAADLIKVNKFENALVILKELETSKEKQIVVRSKMMLGDLLFNQGEYDLASQVYEEITKKYSFSGYVLKALGKLITCSEKLKQPEKQAKYYSLLHDFFESV